MAKLEEIGFKQRAPHQGGRKVDVEAWNKTYEELGEYKQKHGHCHVPQNYRPNKQLGIWAHTQRRQYRLFKQGHHSHLTAEQIENLKDIGFKRGVSYKGWHQRYEELKKYKKEHGHCNVPIWYEENEQLGRWVNNQRQNYRLFQRDKYTPLTGDKIDKLEEIKFKWSI